MKRIFLIVLDSFGIGEMPDAANYGDEIDHAAEPCKARFSMNCGKAWII